ncbi:MAG: alpha/beta hydrolase [Rhodospirillaceae bacterium]|nr:alpha/beta hydrolase [Rhodospirillaceae bacterium]
MSFRRVFLNAPEAAAVRVALLAHGPLGPARGRACQGSSGSARRALVCVFMAALFLAACAPAVRGPGPAMGTPELTGEAFIAADGAVLPLRVWKPEGTPRAVLLALHGFNDYANFFDDPGDFLALRGVQSYAFDQRGFGAAPAPGTWAGVDAYVADARSVLAEIKAHHPGVPLYMQGTSMGGAVAMLAASGAGAPAVDGVILAAPAVWGRVTMPWYQRLVLWVGAHTVPWMTLTGRGLGIVPSDNYEMLVALAADPLIIKETRVGAIYGLVNLMDAALDAAPDFRATALILYGEKDEIIPKGPTRMMLEALPEAARARQRIALYEGGFHMLLRDLQAATVWKDMAAWMVDPVGPLPSKADRRGLEPLGISKARK